jgi:hypothetical protein
MIRLKPLVNELYNNVSNLFSSLVYSSTYLPISIPIIKKMVGNVKTTKVAHVTTYEGYKQLEKLQGKKKGISSFNELGSDSQILRGYGVATRGGVIAILEGKILINSNVDMYSKVDGQGRNWITTTDLFSGKDTFFVDDYLPKEAKVIRDKKKYGHEVTQQEKRDYIKMYIDTATKEMLKRKDIFRKKYFSPSHRYDADDSKTWNEIIVAQMKIKEVAFVEEFIFGYGGFQGQIPKDTKLPKNSVVISQDDIPKFLKKHGIKVS